MKLTRHITYDPKRDGGFDSPQYLKGLKETIKVSLYTALAVKKANPPSGVQTEPDVLFWGRSEDVEKILPELREECDKQAFEQIEVEGVKGLAYEPASVEVEEVESKMKLKLSTCPVKDYAGEVIEGLNLYLLNMTTGVVSCNIGIYDNENLDVLREHAKKRELTSDQEDATVRELIPRILPTGDNYLTQVGQVNDAKKSLILLLRSKIFKQAEFYQDVDVAQRTHLHDNETITVKVREDAEKQGEPPCAVSFTNDVDTLITLENVTNSDALINPLRVYADKYRDKSRQRLRNIGTAPLYQQAYRLKTEGGVCFSDMKNIATVMRSKTPREYNMGTSWMLGEQHYSPQLPFELPSGLGPIPESVIQSFIDGAEAEGLFIVSPPRERKPEDN